MFTHYAIIDNHNWIMDIHNYNAVMDINNCVIHNCRELWIPISLDIHNWLWISTIRWFIRFWLFIYVVSWLSIYVVSLGQLFETVSNYQLHECLLNRLFRRRWKKTSKLRVTGLWEGNSPVTGEFPAQKASNAKKCFHLMTSSWIFLPFIIIAATLYGTLWLHTSLLSHHSRFSTNI